MLIEMFSFIKVYMKVYGVKVCRICILCVVNLNETKEKKYSIKELTIEDEGSLVHSMFIKNAN